MLGTDTSDLKQHEANLHQEHCKKMKRLRVGSSNKDVGWLSPNIPFVTSQKELMSLLTGSADAANLASQRALTCAAVVIDIFSYTPAQALITSLND